MGVNKEFNEITLDDSRSYATLENLRKGLAKFGIDHMRHVVCKNKDNRWTAIFTVNEVSRHYSGYIGGASQYGFMTIG